MIRVFLFMYFRGNHETLSHPFFLCIPSLLFHPLPACAEEQTFYNESGREIFIPRDKEGLITPFGYFDPTNIFSHVDGYIDHYFDFIDFLCDEDFLNTLSEEELERCVEFAVWVIRDSVPQSRPDLKEQYEEDIDELYQILEDDTDYYLSSLDPQAPKIHLCKKKKKGGVWNQIKRKAGHFGHWCNKHKRPLIVGTVVVGTVAVALLTKDSRKSSAVAIGGGLAGAAAEMPPERVNKPGEVRPRELSPQEPNPTPIARPVPSENEEHIYHKIAKQNEITKTELNDEILDEPLNVPEKTFWKEVKESIKEVAVRDLHHTLDQTEPFTEEEELAAHHEVVEHLFHTHKETLQEALEPQVLRGEIIVPVGGNLAGTAQRVAAIAGRVGVGSGVASIISEHTSPSLEPGVSMAQHQALQEISTLQNQLPPGHYQLEKAIGHTCKNYKLNETEIRNVLSKTGYNPPPRPKGIPQDWKVQASNKGGGVKYKLEVPKKTGELTTKTEARVMPTNLSSPKPGQQRNYVVHTVNGQYYNKNDKVVDKNSFEAHIPYEEYDFIKVSQVALNE